MKKPIIIVVGHEKGGTGKSTISNHLSIGMLYANPNMKIAIIDTDVRQATTNIFFTARNNFSKDLIQPTFRLIKLSTNDSKEKSLIEDYVLLTTLLAEFSDYDLIIRNHPLIYLKNHPFSCSVVRPLFFIFIPNNIIWYFSFYSIPCFFRRCIC